MTTWEYAAFQKEQFKEIKKRKREFYVILFTSIIIAFIILFILVLLFANAGKYTWPQEF